MEEDEGIHCDDDRGELKHAEIYLIGADAAHQTLSGLCQSQNGTHVHGDGGDHGREGESLVGSAGSVAAAPDEQREDDDEDGKGEDLKGKTAEKDVVGRGGVFGGGLSDTDERSTGDLDESGDHVGDDEDGQDQLGTERGEVASDPTDGDADQGVDSSLEKISSYGKTLIHLRVRTSGRDLH